jgi:hypothetical protein
MLSTPAPESVRLHGWYMWLIIIVSAIVCALGLFGGVARLR